MVHASVVDGVDGGQVLEHVVVGGERRRRYGRAESIIQLKAGLGFNGAQNLRARRRFYAAALDQ